MEFWGQKEILYPHSISLCCKRELLGNLSGLFCLAFFNHFWWLNTILSINTSYNLHLLPHKRSLTSKVLFWGRQSTQCPYGLISELGKNFLVSCKKTVCSYMPYICTKNEHTDAYTNGFFIFFTFLFMYVDMYYYKAAKIIHF